MVDIITVKQQQLNILLNVSVAFIHTFASI